jgi:PilZ domain
MQPEKRERRSKTASRVELKAKVEICGRDPATPAFEAQSVEVSGRGMQVRTRYLPEIGAPLVLRFEHAGREVIVEADVAWRREGKDGGEFGVKFTALDSKSVVVLKELCGMLPPGSPPPAPAVVEEEDDHTLSYGSPVKLHIEGLGAPMKARVFEGNRRRLKVGSQLEFLKLGRALELEDLTAGGRRGGRVDTVSVQIDPDSQVPHLVVSIRYEGVDDVTPEPTVVDEPKRRNGRVQAASAHATDEAEGDEDLDYDEELDGAEELLKSRFALWATRAGVSLKRNSESLARLSSGTVASTVAWIQRTKPVTSPEATRGRASQKPAARRATRTGASVSMGPAGIQRSAVQRRSTPPAKTAPARDPERLAESLAVHLRKPVTLAIAAAGIFAAGHYLFQDDSSAKFNAKATEFAASTAAQAAPAGALPSAVALKPQPLAVAQQGKGIVANVPMFGPTPMATSEAAPVNPGPPPGAVDEYSMSKDQAFDDKPPAAASRSRAARPVFKSVVCNSQLSTGCA